jgi:uncharacterized repeat protein (TIGR03943 family)
MKVVVQATVLLLFGVALAKLAISDQLLLYVRPAARVWVGLAGLALLALACWTLLGQVLNTPAEPAAAGEVDGEVDGHGHGPVSSAMWLVLAPVIAVLLVAPPALGVYSAQRAPAVRVSAGQHVNLITSSRPLPVSMFLFLLLSVAKPAVMRAQPVMLTGFVLGQRKGGFVLARIAITCCAADASTVRVEVSTSAPAPAVGSWVQVVGTYTGSEPDTHQTPKLTATSIIPVDQPANPYDH